MKTKDQAQVVTGFSLLTDHDIYLFKEGTHFRLYDKLGAHMVTVDGHVVGGVVYDEQPVRQSLGREAPRLLMYPLLAGPHNRRHRSKISRPRRCTVSQVCQRTPDDPLSCYAPIGLAFFWGRRPLPKTARNVIRAVRIA